MKPFSLDAVLKYRKQREDKAATLLAQELNKLQAAKSELSAAEDSLRSLIHNFSIAQNRGILVQELVRYQNRIDWLKNHIVELKANVEKCTQQVNYARNKVIHRSKDRKVMEQLRDRQNKKYKDFLDKKETLQLDEIAVLSHDRRKLNRE